MSWGPLQWGLEPHWVGETLFASKSRRVRPLWREALRVRTRQGAKMQVLGGAEWRIQKPLVEKDVLLHGPLAASRLLQISMRICYNTGNNGLDWR